MLTLPCILILPCMLTPPLCCQVPAESSDEEPRPATEPAAKAAAKAAAKPAAKPAQKEFLPIAKDANTNIVFLRKWLEDRGLQTSGYRGDLLQRIEAYSESVDVSHHITHQSLS